MGEVMNGDSMKGAVDLLTLGITRILGKSITITDRQVIRQVTI